MAEFATANVRFARNNNNIDMFSHFYYKQGLGNVQIYAVNVKYYLVIIQVYLGHQTWLRAKDGKHTLITTYTRILNANGRRV